MKKKKFIIFIAIWVITILILYKAGMINSDIDSIVNLLKGNSLKIKALFVFLSTVRVSFFIPQTVFVLVGSFIFGPYIGFILSIISLLLSQSIMYFVGRYFNKALLEENLIRKHGNIVDVIKSYGYKILALGIICPVTPSDLITALAAGINLSYKKSMLVITISAAPIILLYSFLGARVEGTDFFKVLVVLIVSFISYYSFFIWNKITGEKGNLNKV